MSNDSEKVAEVVEAVLREWERAELEPKEAAAREEQSHFVAAHGLAAVVDEPRRYNDPAAVLAMVEGLRPIVARYEQAERLVRANAEKLVELSYGGTANQEQTMALRVHGYELAGRRDGLQFAVDAVAAMFRHEPGYDEAVGA